MTQRYLLQVLCGNTLSWWKRAHSLCTLTLKNTTRVWISRQMWLFIGLWLDLSAPVTMLPVLNGRGRICPTIGSSFSTPNVLSGLLCVRFWTMICRNANRITAKCSKPGRNCSILLGWIISFQEASPFISFLILSTGWNNVEGNFCDASSSLKSQLPRWLRANGRAKTHRMDFSS